MIERQLEQIARNFLKKHYEMDLEIPVKRNNRLRTTLGRFVMSSDKKPLRIEISGNTLEYGTKEAIIGILKHECIHYALHRKGKASRDGHPYFESELQKHGAPSTNTWKIGKHYIYVCNCCGKESESRLKQLMLTPSKYRTRCCNSKLAIVGERIYDGTS